MSYSILCTLDVSCMLPLDVSVLQQPVLLLDMSVLHQLVLQPQLPLDVSVLQQPMLPLECLSYSGLCCLCTSLSFTSLCCCMSCTWTCLFYSSLCWPWTYLYKRLCCLKATFAFIGLCLSTRGFVCSCSVCLQELALHLCMSVYKSFDLQLDMSAFKSPAL